MSVATHIRQPLHGCALVVCRKMRVLPQDCRAIAPHEFFRS